MADFVIMSQMFDDDNNLSRLSYTCEMLAQTDSEEEMFPDRLFRHIPKQFASTPITKLRKTIIRILIVNIKNIKKNQNLPGREDHISEKEKTKMVRTPKYDSKRDPCKSDKLNEETAKDMQQDLMKVPPKYRSLT